ncbi:MAG: serine/threonine-protein kinase [Pseudomonadota bacterium]
MISHVEQDTEELAPGTRLLRGQYVVEGALAKGGFGITYLARDSLDRKVVIKECYPHSFCCRAGLQAVPASAACAPRFAQILKQFSQEAFRLAALDHPRIVKVHQVFEEHGTSYLAMEHIQGADLFSVVEDDDPRLSADTMPKLLVEALEAVEYIHDQGVLHRDLAPDNIIMGTDGHVSLIDFGASSGLNPDTANDTAKVVVVKDGYSPYEFYSEGTQDASSDLYQLAATFHYLITGYSPPDSPIRMAAIKAHQPDPFVPLTAHDWDIDPVVLQTLNDALSLNRENRPRSAGAWLGCLDGGSEQAFAPKVRTPHVLPDRAIVDEIARLVNTTNSALARSLAEKKRLSDREKDQAADAKRPEPKQLVDIFGNPVHDVEAFLREQEAPEKEEAIPEVSVSHNTSQPQEIGRPLENQSMLGRTITGLLAKKSDVPLAASQN